MFIFFRYTFVIIGLIFISQDVYGQSFSIVKAIESRIFPTEEVPLSPQEILYRDSLDIAKSMYIRLIYGHNMDSIDLIEKQYGKYIELSDSEINTAKYLYFLGLKHHIRSELDSAEYFYKKSLYLIPESFPGTHVQKYRIMALGKLALIYHENYYNPAKAIQYLDNAIQRCDKYFYPGYRQMAHAHLSSIYRYQGDYQKAIDTAEEALEHNAFNRAWNKGGKDYLHYILIRELATSFQQCDGCNKKYKAFELLKETLRFYRKDEDIAGQAEVLSDLAVYYTDYSNGDQQDEYIKEARLLSAQYGHQDVHNYVDFRYAKYLYQRSKFLECKEVLNRLLVNVGDTDLLNRSKIFNLLSKVFDSLDQKGEALRHYKNSVEYKRKIAVNYNSTGLKKMQSNTEVSNSKALVGLLQNRNKIIYSLGILSIGLMVISLLLLLSAIYSRRKIRKQNIELKEANKAKNELFLILSHDLKGPISSFDNLSKRVSYLLQKKDYEGLHKFTEYFSSAGDSLKYTVTSLLDWSLSQKDNFILDIERINVLSELNFIIEELNYLIRDRNIEIHRVINENSKVTCDKNSFQIIYRNLLHNAIKNSDVGGKIEIVVEESEVLNIFVKNKISVTSLDKIEKIKTLINNPQRGVSMKMRTSGIGLYTVSNLINHNKGKMSVIVENQFLVIKTSLPLST